MLPSIFFSFQNNSLPLSSVDNKNTANLKLVRNTQDINTEGKNYSVVSESQDLMDESATFDPRQGLQ